MGTRNLTCVKLDGEYRVAQYGQYDGYPSYAIKIAFKFLKSLSNREVYKSFVSAIRNCSFINGRVDDAFLPSTSTAVLKRIYDNDGALLTNSLEFAADSLFCEYAYVIDLDENTFNVYFGLNKEPLSNNDRFYDLEHLSEGEYHPVKLARRFDLLNLPDTYGELIDIVFDESTPHDIDGEYYKSSDTIAEKSEGISSLFGGAT